MKGCFPANITIYLAGPAVRTPSSLGYNLQPTKQECDLIAQNRIDDMQNEVRSRVWQLNDECWRPFLYLMFYVSMTTCERAPIPIYTYMIYIYIIQISTSRIRIGWVALPLNTLSSRVTHASTMERGVAKINVPGAMDLSTGRAMPGPITFSNSSS